MFKNLAAQLVKKGLYGIAGNVGAMLLFAVNGYQPQGDTVTLYLWQSLVVGAATGVAAALHRWAAWDPARAR